MNFFDEAALRLKQQLRCTEDRQVAEVLGLSPRAWVGRKKRGNFPEKELWALAAKRPDLKLDVIYVLTGVARGEEHKTAAAQRGRMRLLACTLVNELHRENTPLSGESFGYTLDILWDEFGARPEFDLEAVRKRIRKIMGWGNTRTVTAVTASGAHSIAAGGNVTVNHGPIKQKRRNS